MHLVIPDYTIANHVPQVYKYFEDYNIAKLKNVTYYDYPSEENDEDEPFFGYIIIEVEQWFDNVTSRNFYNSISNNNCKMVYDDPHLWDVEFYEPSTLEEVNNIVLVQEDKFDVVKDDEDKEYLKSETVEVKEQMESDEEDDENYEFVESNEDEDYKYEYLSQKCHKMNTRYKTKCEEDKSKATNLNTENITLTEIIVKKNKKYMKRNKRKVYKNEWNRRLRVKLTV